MEQQAQLTLIETYLADETQMYQDWYKGLQQGQSESSMTPFAAKLPSNENITKRFQGWFTQHKELLKVKICIEWEYQRKKPEFHKKELLISSIADALALLGIPANVIATAAWLVIKGHLDHICVECSKE